MPQNNSQQGNDDWREMLRAILGDEAAEEIAKSLEEQGIDPSAQLPEFLHGENFTMITQQIQDMLGSSGDGPVNWKIAEKIARDTIVQSRLDRLTSADGDSVRNALRTASLWLDAACAFDPATGPNLAWSRLDWIAHSLATFRRLLDPVGTHLAAAFDRAFTEQMKNMPSELQSILGNPQAMMRQMTASMIGVQYGLALAELASHSFGSTDTGLPLTAGSSAALVPANLAEFGANLEVDFGEVQMYIAVRESAATRLYSRVPWLRARVLDTVAEFASGIDINMNSIEEQIRGIDLANPSGMQELDLSDVFNLDLNERQSEALARLVHLLSLVEGWVSEVAARAVAPHLPHAVALREMFNRRYATDNPAKNVWGTQLGMELEPKLLRQAVRFWQLAEARLGIEQRDALWNHPDLLPSPAALEMPESFFAEQSSSDIEQELDSFLSELFSTEDAAQEASALDAPDDVPHEPRFGERHTDQSSGRADDTSAQDSNTGNDDDDDEPGTGGTASNKPTPDR
ncbi:MAG: zinc-dependent metalloprotease [Actinomycetaceae bacterium]|nr:zinc-dependent metalloprotease [Arcanobacterium sp.]MDD7505293.1 zinc-dependent metalloprotease [Actinomycetaceae bacterium]MDY6143519.1 zinc-dependent metalloprotease [Arcanobacterium sp.]